MKVPQTISKASLGLGLFWLALVLSGCGGGTSISGTVSLDGQPVDFGSIVFVPDNIQEGKKGGALIENGKYFIPPEKSVLPGEYRVEIHWAKKTGKKIPVDPPNMEDETKEAIPAKFNTNSQLKVQITAGNNEHNFPLTSK